jgi:SepF-like predicted cell division protein (DUF552 family)
MPINAIRRKIDSIFKPSTEIEMDEEYVELETDARTSRAKVLVKLFTVNKFEDIKPVLDAIREGSTIGLLNIGPIKERDVSELKRSIDKIKKTIDANDGDIAGFKENWLVVTPSFARVWREPKQEGGE